jgi:FeS assembly SUF system regulator
MLKIGKMTDYAMLVLSTMAKNPDSVLSAASVAESLNLSVPTVSKILKILGESGLVSSIRGAEGGYHLGKSAKDICVTEVIEAMEGELAMTECCESANNCNLGSTCSMQGNWLKINQLIKDLLSRLSILDMEGPISLEGVLHGK